ncbi:MAG: agmatinase [Rhodomicrobium sp.]|nr:agmatinase [Rhodomicrobium sp.]
MSDLTFRPQNQGFLGLPEEEAGAPQAARAVIIPFGLEATVSYGSGTAKGPEAIIAASPQLEFFDEALWAEPFRQFGIATLAPFEVFRPIEKSLSQLESLVRAVLDAGKFPLVLGGEHALTPGAVRPLAARHRDLVVLQFDAHADLRDGYLGEAFSHASAMRRTLDDPAISLVQVGIRAISAEEIPFLEANRGRIATFWAKDKERWDIADIVAAIGGRPVYLSFDIDAFDASLMPATGTPEPGGLFFNEAIAIVEAAAKASPIVGADVVELAPIPVLHACDFTAAKLVYKILTAALYKR